MTLQISTKGIGYFSPLRYPGGKASLYHVISELLDNNDLLGKTYVEPYAGGAGVALSLLMMEKVSNIIINDFDPAIYAFWRTILCEPDKFNRRIQSTEVTTDEWERQKRIFKNTKSSFSLAFATFFLNRTSYSGVISKSGPIGGKSQSGKWKVDARFDKDRLCERIERIAYYRDRIDIRNMDGIRLVKDIARRDDVFVYLDPPYYVKGSKLYLNAYGHDDHLALASMLNDQRSLKWALTYDNVPEIQAMYQNLKSTPFEIGYSVNRKTNGKEIMIFSDAVETPQHIHQA